MTFARTTVAITGADGGIGQALCRYFDAEGGVGSSAGNIVMTRELTLEDF